jgi:hypothetical protein
MPPSPSQLWQKAYELTYQAWYGEELAADLLRRWRAADGVIAVAVALTSTTSAVSGWALWTQTGWKTLWLFLAGAAAVTSVIHTRLGISRVVEDLDSSWQRFLDLRTDCRSLLDRLDLGLPEADATDKYFALQSKAKDAEKAFKPGFIRPSPANQAKAQERVNHHLRAFLKESVS